MKNVFEEIKYFLFWGWLFPPSTHIDKVPQDFKVGEIYLMAVAKRSHVTKPYYVHIVGVDAKSITTNVINQHMLNIRYRTYEWAYHIPRMQYAGLISDSNKCKLLYNQTLT